MVLLRILKFLIRHLAFELIALMGAVAYVLLDNALPELAGRLLAGALVVTIVALIVRRFVRVLKDPVGSVRWPSKDYHEY